MIERELHTPADMLERLVPYVQTRTTELKSGLTTTFLNFASGDVTFVSADTNKLVRQHDVYGAFNLRELQRIQNPYARNKLADETFGIEDFWDIRNHRQGQINDTVWAQFDSQSHDWTVIRKTGDNAWGESELLADEHDAISRIVEDGTVLRGILKHFESSHALDSAFATHLEEHDLRGVEPDYRRLRSEVASGRVMLAGLRYFFPDSGIEDAATRLNQLEPEFGPLHSSQD